MTEAKHFHDFFGGEAEVGDVAKSVVMITDPLLVDGLADKFTSAKTVANHYEFKVVTGEADAIPVTLCSTGLGGGSTSIAVDNLVRLGAERLIMIDAGLVEDPIERTQYWCATGAVRRDGASLDYAPAEFPAVASPDVQLALHEASADLGTNLRPAVLWASVLPLAGEFLETVRRYNRGLHSATAPYGVPLVRSTPEFSTVLTLGTLYRRSVGGLFGEVPNRQGITGIMEVLFDIALQACRIMTSWEDGREMEQIRMILPNGPRSEKTHG